MSVGGFLSDAFGENLPFDHRLNELALCSDCADKRRAKLGVLL